VGSTGLGDYEKIISIIPKKRGTEKIVDAMFGIRDDVIIRAPAGSGKTFVAVAYAICEALNNRRTAIFFRTKAEMENALGIAKTIIENTETNLPDGSIIPLAGRETMCIFGDKTFRNIPDFARALYCFVMECPVRFRRVPQRPSLRTSLRDYVSFYSGYKACAYHSLLREARTAPIIFATHPFLVQDELFRYLGSLDTAIIDEAHALNIITHSIGREEYRDGSRIAEEVEGDEERGAGRWILENWAFRRRDVLVYEKYKYFRSRSGRIIHVGDEIIKVQPPLFLLQQRRSRIRRFVVMSATLYPIGMIKKLWGIKRVITIGKLIEPTRNRLYVALVLPGITTKLERRDSRLYRAIASLIRFIQSKLPDKLIVVFCVSKDFAKQIADILGKSVVADPNKIKSIEDNLIITYARGKLSEGIDAIAGRNPDVVVAVGLPYPAVDKRFLAIAGKAAEIIGVDKRQFVRDYMNSEMVGALIQLMGRAGRRKKGACIIIDERAVIFPSIPFVTNTISLKDAVRKFFGV